MTSRFFNLVTLFAAMACLATTLRAEEPSDLVDPKKLLESVPKDLLKDCDTNSRNRVEAIDAASTKLRESVKEKTGTLSLTVKSINKFNGRYSVHSAYGRLRAGGTNFSYGASIFFNESENAKVLKVKVGDKVTATGRIFAVISGTTLPYFHIEIGDATLK